LLGYSRNAAGDYMLGIWASSDSEIDRKDLNMARSNILTLALSVVLVLLCANVEAQTRQFKVCVPDYAVGVMPLIIAKQNGYYAQEQLDVEVIAARGHLCSMGLLANSFQFTYSPSTFDAVVAGDVKGK